MGSTIIGWILIIIGLLFILLGLTAAVKLVLIQHSRHGSEESLAEIASILELFVDLLKALSKAPQWLALTIIGLVLIIFGSNMAF